MPFIEQVASDTQPVTPVETPAVQPVADTTPVTPVVDTPVIPTTPTPPITEIEIEGIGKVKIDDVKQWQQGNMRLQDYTRKTQEIAQQRKEAQEALELRDYLKNNPAVATALQNGTPLPEGVDYRNTPLGSLDPASKRVEALESDIATWKLDTELERLQGKYKDFDVVKVLQIADEKGITDLEFIYNSIKGQSTDVASLKEQLMKEIRQSLTEEIRKDGLSTQTIINAGDTTPIANHGLNADEMHVAERMGLTYEQYAKYK